MGNPVREALHRLVVGQVDAQVSLSRLIDMHLTWFAASNHLHRSPNALVIGPTGTGKTHAIRVAADALDIPCVIVDSTRLVSTGAGDNLPIESVVRQLVRKARAKGAGGKPEQIAERGIVFLDEFDKLRFDRITDDTAAVQRRLLQLIEGDTIDLAPEEEDVPRTLNSQGILFIAAGAFTGIDKHKSQRKVGRGSMHGIQAEDVRRYGFLEELVARLPIIIRFDPLTAGDLRGILTHPEISPFAFYQEYFKRHGIELLLSPEVLEEVAKEAESAGLGARGLHLELFPLLNSLANEAIDDAAGPIRQIEVTPSMHRRLKNGTSAFEEPDA